MLPQLLGLGATGLEAEVDGFLLQAPNPNSSQVAEFLKLYAAGNKRDDAGKALIARGVNPATVSAALSWLAASSRIDWNKVVGVLSIASAALSGYHGYRRNNSVAWGVGWFALGAIFPVVTPVIAVAQGFGKRKA